MTETADLLVPSPPHRACSQLLVPGLGDDTVSRFVLGLDEQPVLLSAAETAAELNDQFAVRLLRAGIFPNTAGELLHALEQSDPGGPLSQQSFFLVGEGSQLSAAVTGVQRNMRFLVACGQGPDGSEVVVSSFHPDQGMVEVMAWDQGIGGFNFYRTMPESNAWVFAGNSRHALTGATRRHGPFESHVNGNIVMKELKTPWVHWDSPFARVPASSLAAQGLDTHPWVQRLDPGGAYSLEDLVVKPSISRWSATRAAAILAGTAAETPGRMVEQLVGTMTVNLHSSHITSASALGGSSSEVDLPSTFFVDVDCLELVDLPGPPNRLRVSAAIYTQALTDFDVRLEDGGGFTQPGDTHFAFVVPERAFEDVATIREALRAGLLTPRLVACLLMVDFPNPVFSPQRETLGSHVEAVPWTGDGASYSEAVAQAILTSEQAAVEGTAEAEFASRWAVGDSFADSFSADLNVFYGQLEAALASAEGFAAVYELAEWRRSRVKQMPIFESPMLFSTCNITPSPRHMTVAATVVEETV